MSTGTTTTTTTNSIIRCVFYGCVVIVVTLVSFYGINHQLLFTSSPSWSSSWPVGHYSNNNSSLNYDRDASRNLPTTISSASSTSSVLAAASAALRHQHPKTDDDYHHDTNNENDGMGSCLLVLEDSIRIVEWIAYHYTMLPLKRLIIGLDKKNPAKFRQRLQHIQQLWKEATTSSTSSTTPSKLDIIIWENETKWIDPTYSPKGHKEHRKRQDQFLVECMKTHKELHQQEEKLIKMKRQGTATNVTNKTRSRDQYWLLLVDSDEYLIPNYIIDEEDDNDGNIASEYPTIKWKTQQSIDRRRKTIQPIRQYITEKRRRKEMQTSNFGDGSSTILDLLQHLEQVDESTIKNNPFSHKLPNCFKLPALQIGVKEDTTDRKQELLKSLHLDHKAEEYYSTLLEYLQTYKYNSYGRNGRGIMSKTLINIANVPFDEITIENVHTSHIPNRYACGYNGPYGSGADYLSSILRINHYVSGTIESFLERSHDWRGRSLSKYYERSNTMVQNVTPTTTHTNEIHDWLPLFTNKMKQNDVALKLLQPIVEWSRQEREAATVAGIILP